MRIKFIETRLNVLGLLIVICLAPVLVQAGEGGQRASVGGLIGFFQKNISPVDGGRCPMRPSCSAYAAQAVEKHGPVMGWIMACDRLMRCGHDELHISPQVRIHGQNYTLDPVAANDFWWFSASSADRDATLEKIDIP